MACAGALALSAAAEEPLETTVRGASDPEPSVPGRAVSRATAADFDRRLPRSAPDALRYEPGVFVQQTAHGQASAFIRGMTGQQTLLEFDGVRLNNSTYRQGPNQYFFTLDLHTLAAVEVLRGGSSTQHGADALGGVLSALPLEPQLPATGTRVEPRVSVRGTTADEELGGRVQVDVGHRLSSGTAVGLLAGVGARRVGLLHGPPVLNPDRSTPLGPLPWVPRYAEYVPELSFEQQPALRTQLGTGFNEVTADARAVARFSRGDELTLAAYLYRQYDAPRTDQCPAPAAPSSECLTYEQQFRTLVYGRWRGGFGAAAQDARLTVSWQQQHEQRRLDFTAANQVARSVDDVDTLGLSFRATSATLGRPAGVTATLSWGADTFVDLLRSKAGHVYTDTLDAVEESRGQYLNGSFALTGGAYADATVRPATWLALRGGGRLAWSAVNAPADLRSGTQAVARAWVPVVGHVGVEVGTPTLTGFLSVDRSFRTPNLDDLTSRQQTGPGFQFENPSLAPEVAHAFELGGRVRWRALALDVWAFETLVSDAILKVTKPTSSCPPSTPQCLAAWSRVKLENAPGLSELRGFEASGRVVLPARLTLRATVAYAWSEGPRLGVADMGGTIIPAADRVPLSRTPPLNGTAELAWSLPHGLGLGAALQWAAAQDRLAIADYADGRIPRYGTPAFAVAHLRAWWRPRPGVAVALALENVFDSPYRFHGSSVNGAGRGLQVQADLGALMQLNSKENP